MQLIRLLGLTFGGMLLISSVTLAEVRRADSTAGWLAYIVDEGGFDEYQIHIMTADGEKRRQVTHSISRKYDLAWSPDSSWLVYSQRYPGDDYFYYHLYQIDTVGHSRRQLTAGDVADEQPMVSPNGDNTILFFSNRGGFGLFRMETDGSNIKRLTEDIDGFDPLWSADGEWIYFINGERGMFRMRPDGSDVQQIREGPLFRSPYAVSPDDRWLAIVNIETPETVLRVMPSGGGELEFIANDLYPETNVVWSPDGEWVGYIGLNVAEYTTYIVRVRPDGSESEVVLEGDQNMPIISDLAWSPDGDWITFAGGLRDERELYRIRPDDRDLQRLTYHDGVSVKPYYSPIIDLSLGNRALMVIGGCSMMVAFGIRRFAKT